MTTSKSDETTISSLFVGFEKLQQTLENQMYKKSCSIMLYEPFKWEVGTHRDPCGRAGFLTKSWQPGLGGRDFWEGFFCRDWAGGIFKRSSRLSSSRKSFEVWYAVVASLFDQLEQTRTTFGEETH